MGNDVHTSWDIVGTHHPLLSRGTPSSSWADDACMAFGVSHRALEPLPPGTEPQLGLRAVLANTPGVWVLCFQLVGKMQLLEICKLFDPLTILTFCCCWLLRRQLEPAALSGSSHKGAGADRTVAGSRPLQPALSAAHRRAIVGFRTKHSDGRTRARGRGATAASGGAPTAAYAGPGDANMHVVLL